MNHPLVPVAARRPHVTTVHGQQHVDDYYWLRDKDNPEVLAQSENAYTKKVMAHTAAFQEALYQEMLARIQETDMSVPYREGAFDYYSRTEEGKDYPIYCRRSRAAGPQEQVALDMNAMAEGHEFFALDRRDRLPRVHVAGQRPRPRRAAAASDSENTVDGLGQRQPYSVLRGRG